MALPGGLSGLASVSGSTLMQHIRALVATTMTTTVVSWTRHRARVQSSSRR